MEGWQLADGRGTGRSWGSLGGKYKDSGLLECHIILPDEWLERYSPANLLSNVCNCLPLCVKSPGTHWTGGWVAPQPCCKLFCRWKISLVPAGIPTPRSSSPCFPSVFAHEPLWLRKITMGPYMLDHVNTVSGWSVSKIKNLYLRTDFR